MRDEGGAEGGLADVRLLTMLEMQSKSYLAGTGWAHHEDAVFAHGIVYDARRWMVEGGGGME